MDISYTLLYLFLRFSFFISNFKLFDDTYSKQTTPCRSTVIVYWVFYSYAVYSSYLYVERLNEMYFVGNLSYPHFLWPGLFWPLTLKNILNFYYYRHTIILVLFPSKKHLRRQIYSGWRFGLYDPSGCLAGAYFYNLPNCR